MAKSPGEAANHFSWLGYLLDVDSAASSAFMQQQLGRYPSQPTLLADLNQGHYFES